MSPVVASRRFSPARFLTLLVANLVWLAPLFLAPATSASAQIIVNTLTDDAPGSAANCPTTCSLRDAILAANAATGSTIQFQSGLAGTYALTAALPAITVSTTITGNSDPGLVVVSGGPAIAAFAVQTGAVASSTVTLQGFTIANAGGGYISGFGSGLFIYNPPTGAYLLTVNVTNMVFSGNSASDGGAITTDGTAAPLTNGITLNVVGSTFTKNTSTSNGGAIWNGGVLNVSSSTFSSNSSPQGAGIYNCDDAATCFGSVTVSDSTFANNSNPVGGGTIYNANTAGVLTVYDSTFYDNTGGSSPASVGGSIANAGTTFSVTNSIFANPTTTGNECTTVAVTTGTGCPASPQTTPDTNGDLQDTSTNLKLSSLGNYGGLTATLVPGTGSAAICGGIGADAKNVDGSGLTADQRGFPPDPCGGGNVDSGSVQVGGNTITVTTPNDDSGTPLGVAANCPGANCSLRDAIAAANAAGTATIDFSITGTITLGAELPLSTSNVVINGPGAGSLTLSGAGKYRILENYTGSMSVSGVTFDSGNSGAQGGAFINAAVGSLDHVAFTNNTGTSGGAIYSIRSLTITNSTFTGNSVGGGNGGAIDATGALQVYDSTFNNNTAGQGAAIYDESDTQLPIYYSTFANNTNSAAGTLTTNSQSIMVVANDTFSGNTAATEDQDIYHNGGSLTVTNSIIGDANGCGITPDPACTAAGNVLFTSGLALGALGSYGGPTYTMLPLPGSSAICGGVLANVPSGYSLQGQDQRGFSNATPGSYGVANCSDAGSVQTDYTSAQFAAATYAGNANTPINPPAVTVTVTENGLIQGGVPVTIGVTGLGTVTGNGPVASVSGTGAAFTALQVTGTGTGTASIDPITVTGAYALPAGTIPTATLNIAATGTTTTTTVSTATAPFNAASQNVTLTATVSGGTINEGQVTFTVTGGTFPGTQLSGAVAGGVATVSYAIPAGEPIGAYTITGVYADTGGTFNTSTGTNTLDIAGAPTIAFTIPNHTYGDAAFNVTATSNSAGAFTYSLVSGPATVTAGGLVTLTGAGTVVVQASEAANGFYTTGTKNATFSVAAATPVLSITNSPVTYNGAVQQATLTATATGITGAIAGAFSAVEYNGSATVPTAAGTYAVTATFTPTNTTNFNTVAGVSAGNFVINKATPTLSVTNSPAPYTGAPVAATLAASVTGITGTIAGTFTGVLYSGSGTVPTAAATYAMTATFTPTDTTNFNTVTGGSAGNFIIGKSTPTLSVTNSPVTYKGTAQAATVIGSVSGTVSNILYNGSATVPANAGTYAITANFTPTDTINYNTVTGGAAGNFVINKATPTLAVTNSPVAYTGTAQTATVAASATGITGNVAGVVSAELYSGSATAPTNAGTYAVTATFTPTDTANFNTVTAGAAGNFVIGKSTPPLTVTNSPVTYTGAAQTATLSSGGVAGAFSSELYNGSATAPTTAGTYAVTATFTPTDTTDYNTVTTGAAGNFVIGKATPTLSVTNSPVTYTGAAHTATVTGSVAGTVTGILYSGSATAPTAAGTYAITANFTPSDTTDYATLTAASAGNFVIGKATPTVSVTNSPQPYTGTPQTATVAGSVAGSVSAILYNGSATAPTAAATYAITANFVPTDTTDYNSLTAAAAGNFVIGKVNPTLSVTNSPVAYTGAAQAATVTGSVAGTVTGILYNGSATVPMAAGTYAITANFTPTDATDYNTLTAASAGNFVIGKGAPTLSVTNSPVTFSGTAQAAVVTGSVPGTVSGVMYNGSATVPTAAGTYAITANFTPADTANYSSLTAASAGSFVIAKAVPALSVTNSPVPYSGNPQAAIVNGSVPGAVSAVLYNGSATVPSAAGTYAITASFTPTDSTDYGSLTAASAGNFVITTIAPTITFSVPNHTYGDAPFTVAAKSNSTGAITYSVVSGPATIAGATVTLTGAGTVMLKATQVASGSYTAGTQTASFTVGAGTPTIAWTPAATIQYGASLSGLLNAKVSFGGGSVAGSFAYTATPTGGTASPVTSSTVLAEGTYMLTATFTPTDATDYKTATANAPLTVTGQTLTVSANSASKVYGTANPTFTGTVTGAVSGDTFTESFTTTATTTSNAGTYPIVPSVTGANLSNYTVVVNDGTLTVTQAGTTIGLTASSSSINPGSSVTLTATVASATTGTPTGIVTFYDGSTSLGTGMLAAGAGGDVATLSITSLVSGSHTLTAVYAGDSNFTASSTTSSISIGVAPLGLTISASPTTNSGKAGGTFNYTLSVAPAFAGTPYPGAVSFAANGGPAGAVIFFSPSTLAANAGPQTVNMSIATSLSSAAVHAEKTGRGFVPVALAFLLLPLAGTRRMRRNGQRFARFLCLLLLALAGVAATTALTGCGSSTGGSSSNGNGTQYTITVTATSGSVSQNTTVTLTLQ